MTMISYDDNNNNGVDKLNSDNNGKIAGVRAKDLALFNLSKRNL